MTEPSYLDGLSQESFYFYPQELNKLTLVSWNSSRTTVAGDTKPFRILKFKFCNRVARVQCSQQGVGGVKPLQLSRYLLC